MKLLSDFFNKPQPPMDAKSEFLIAPKFPMLSEEKRGLKLNQRLASDAEDGKLPNWGLFSAFMNGIKPSLDAKSGLIIAEKTMKKAYAAIDKKEDRLAYEYAQQAVVSIAAAWRKNLQHNLWQAQKSNFFSSEVWYVFIDACLYLDFVPFLETRSYLSYESFSPGLAQILGNDIFWPDMMYRSLKQACKPSFENTNLEAFYFLNDLACFGLPEERSNALELLYQRMLSFDISNDLLSIVKIGFSSASLFGLSSEAQRKFGKFQKIQREAIQSSTLTFAEISFCQDEQTALNSLNEHTSKKYSKKNLTIFNNQLLDIALNSHFKSVALEALSLLKDPCEAELGYLGTQSRCLVQNEAMERLESTEKGRKLRARLEESSSLVVPKTKEEALEQLGKCLGDTGPLALSQLCNTLPPVNFVPPLYKSVPRATSALSYLVECDDEKFKGQARVAIFNPKFNLGMFPWDNWLFSKDEQLKFYTRGLLCQIASQEDKTFKTNILATEILHQAWRIEAGGDSGLFSRSSEATELLCVETSPLSQWFPSVLMKTIVEYMINTDQFKPHDFYQHTRMMLMLMD